MTSTTLTQLATDPAVAYFIDTANRRLEAGVVDKALYIAETRDALNRKRDAIGEALLAGELQEDQARHSTRVTDAQLEALALLEQAACTCPPDARHWWDCTGCPVHGEAASKAGDEEIRSEQQAESAWLRAAEYDPRMEDPREW